jgi:hypothetical protein
MLSRVAIVVNWVSVAPAIELLAGDKGGRVVHE